MTVTNSDLRRLCDVADPRHLDGPGDPLPVSLLAALRDLVPCDEVSYESQIPSRREVVCLQEFLSDGQPAVPDDASLDEFYWDHMWPACPWNPPRTGDYVTVHRSTDGQTAGEFAASPGAEYHRLIGLRHLVTVPLPPVGGIDYRIMLWRVDGANFSDRETALLMLLRPHLVAMHDEVLRRSGPAVRLTSRQLELMGLVAGGHTNTQIAHRMFLSEGTVRRHLENAYQRLGVTNRMAAVAATFPGGHQPVAPVPPPPEPTGK